MKKLIAALFIAALAPVGVHAQTGDAPTGDAVAGKALWQSNAIQCKNCHGAAGEGAFGPDLAGRGLSAAQFTRAVRKPWGVMPMFIDTQVSDAELANLAAYFASLPKNDAPGAWRVAVDPTTPHGQQVMVEVGCAQCHGATFNGPRTTLGATGGDFELFKSLVYTHTDSIEKVDADVAAARAAALGASVSGAPGGGAPGGGTGNAGAPRVHMGNFVSTRVTEGQLRDIYDWAKDGIGFRPSLQARLTSATPGAPTYNLTLANTGIENKGVVAQGLVVDLSIPAGVTVASATGDGYKGVHKDANGADVAEWQISRLAPKDSQALTITLSAVPADRSGLKGAVHWAKPGPKSGPSMEVMNFALAGAGGGRPG